MRAARVNINTGLIVSAGPEVIFRRAWKIDVIATTFPGLVSPNGLVMQQYFCTESHVFQLPFYLFLVLDSHDFAYTGGADVFEPSDCMSHRSGLDETKSNAPASRVMPAI